MEFRDAAASLKCATVTVRAEIERALTAVECKAEEFFVVLFATCSCGCVSHQQLDNAITSIGTQVPGPTCGSHGNVLDNFLLYSSPSADMSNMQVLDWQTGCQAVSLARLTYCLGTAPGFRQASRPLMKCQRDLPLSYSVELNSTAEKLARGSGCAVS